MPVVHSYIYYVPDALLMVQLVLYARRKQTRILISKSVSDGTESVGDLVESHHKTGREKSGEWVCPRFIIGIYR